IPGRCRTFAGILPAAGSSGRIGVALTASLWDACRLVRVVVATPSSRGSPEARLVGTGRRAGQECPKGPGAHSRGNTPMEHRCRWGGTNVPSVRLVEVRPG